MRGVSGAGVGSVSATHAPQMTVGALKQLETISSYTCVANQEMSNCYIIRKLAVIMVLCFMMMVDDIIFGVFINTVFRIFNSMV